MKNTSLWVLLGLSLSFASCKKDDDPTKKEMLVGKNWMLTAATIDPSIPLITGGTTNNLYNQLPPCTRDDIFRLSDDGKSTTDEGATKCAVSDPQTVTGTWVLSADEKTLTITEGTQIVSYTIKSLSSSKFEASIQEDINGVIYTTTFTFEPK